MGLCNKTNEQSSEKLTLTSKEINLGLHYYRQVGKTNKQLLGKLFEVLPVIKGGVDLNGSVFIAAGTLAASLGVSPETIGRAKEELHARGIITIDNQPWEDYRYNDGTRYKAKWVHSMKFTPLFISAFHKAASKRIPIEVNFERHPDYIKKLQNRSERNFIAKIKYMIKSTASFGDKLLKSCGNYTMESVRAACESYSIPSVDNLNSISNLNTLNDRIKSSCGFEKKEFSIEKMNSLLTNAIVVSKRELKKWTDSVSKLCESLIQSGKTAHEVAQIMISQSYCNTIDEFFTRMNLKPKPS